MHRHEDCAWAAIGLCPSDMHARSRTPDCDWRVARRAVSCSGQHGCPRSAVCASHAQAVFLDSATKLIGRTLRR